MGAVVPCSGNGHSANGTRGAHFARRDAADFRKAYRIACHYSLLRPADANAVAKLLRCSIRWAEKLTKDARERERLEREAAALTASAEGKSNRKIAEDLGVSPRTVGRIVGAADANSAETPQADGGGPDPWAEARVAQGPVGRRWHDALEALRGINAQADVTTMFADRYRGFDHAIGPELKRAHAWINELHRRFFEGDCDQ